MPTGPSLDTPCYICNQTIRSHGLEESERCEAALHELRFGVLDEQQDKLFHYRLVRRDPERLINGRHCRTCFSCLPGEWGDGPARPRDPDHPDARMCGACLREISHNCHENVIETSGGYQCEVCLRDIDMAEFVRVVNHRIERVATGRIDLRRAD